MKFKSRLRPSQNLIDMTPLVNVIFLMLIFFIVTSNVLPLKSLHVENPEVNLNSTPLTAQILVVMDAQQVIYVGNNKEIVDLGSCRERILNEIEKIKKYQGNPNPTLVLSVDKRVDYGTFFKLFTLVQECIPSIRLVYQSSSEAS